MSISSPLGIVAGGGLMPRRLAETVSAANRPVFIIAFDGETNPATVEGFPHLWTRMGAVAKNIDALKKANVTELVFCGGVKRPPLKQLAPDWRATKFLAKVSFAALGDDGLLKAVKAEMEKEGFTVRGVHEFLADLPARNGVMGRFTPSEEDYTDIRIGYAASQKIGAQDIGQSVIVCNGYILGEEDEAGTDALIARCVALPKGEGHARGVLVKSAKPQQDMSLDLPTIGPDTVRAVHKAGFGGIAVEAGKTLILERDEAIALADEAGIFLIGI
ncbi:MAG: LpxI family protein [Pseudobdellovibrionaceae bacterium]